MANNGTGNYNDREAFHRNRGLIRSSCFTSTQFDTSGDSDHVHYTGSSTGIDTYNVQQRRHCRYNFNFDINNLTISV